MAKERHPSAPLLRLWFVVAGQPVKVTLAATAWAGAAAAAADTPALAGGVTTL